MSGKELWCARQGEGYSMGSSPVFDHGLTVFGTGLMNAQLVAVRVDGQGDVTATHVALEDAATGAGHIVAGAGGRRNLLDFR